MMRLLLKIREKQNEEALKQVFVFRQADFLYLDAESSYSNARSANAPETKILYLWQQNGLTWVELHLKISNNFQQAYVTRILTDRPANEDNSIIANGYQQFDATVKLSI